MTEKTIKNRLKGYFTIKGEPKTTLRKHFYSLSALAKGVRLHTKSWTYNRNRMQLKGADKEIEILHILSRLKIGFERGNDAPKGGVVGDYIVISKWEQRKKLKDLVNLIEC